MVDVLKTWREQRARRVVRKLSLAGLILAPLAFLMDLHFSPSTVIDSDLVLFSGCLLSWWGSRKNWPSWSLAWPLMIGFWLMMVPSVYYTGGLNSPFFGYYLCTFLLCSVLVQNLIPALYLAAFAFVHLAVFYVLDSRGLLPSAEVPREFVGGVSLVMMAAVAICLHELLFTERKVSEEFSARYSELNSARAELHKEEAANHAKTTFLANVSHELRTPLSAILGFAEMLRNPQADATHRALYSETIHRNGKQLERLVDDLLDLAKIEAGKIEILNSPVLLRALLTEVLDTTRIMAQVKGLSVQVEYKGPVPEMMMTDSTRLRQILLNILGNAVKFTTRGSVRLQVEHENSRILFSIHDTGPGISESERERLFKPFSQGDHSLSNRFGGTGLGLSLSRRLARLLDGELELVDSHLGQGSVFRLTLPVGAVEQQSWTTDFNPKFSSLHVTPMLPAHEVLRQCRVLIVDDSEDNLHLMRLILAEAGAVVTTAHDGVQGLELALTSGFDVVLMDIQMPNMDGYETTRLLRQEGYAGPILALTANARREDRDRCLAAGCNAHLTKPISRHDLVAAVLLMTAKEAAANVQAPSQA